MNMTKENRREHRELKRREVKVLRDFQKHLLGLIRQHEGLIKQARAIEREAGRAETRTNAGLKSLRRRLAILEGRGA